jgi:hypothetical protein
MEVRGQLHALIALLPGKWFPGTCGIGGWVSPRANLDVAAKGKIFHHTTVEYIQYAFPQQTSVK